MLSSLAPGRDYELAGADGCVVYFTVLEVGRLPVPMLRYALFPAARVRYENGHEATETLLYLSMFSVREIELAAAKAA